MGNISHFYYTGQEYSRLKKHRKSILVISKPTEVSLSIKNLLASEKETSSILPSLTQK